MVPTTLITSPAQAAPPDLAHLPAILAAAAEQFGPEPGTLTAATTLRDLRADSLDRVELVYAVEEACGVDIADADSYAMTGDTTLADLAALVAKAKAVAA
jgi:acyl carrier protein